ncbi:MAG: hypothetical protein QOI95_1820 [Acidimicrobiaceae bacterium]
MQGRRQEAPKRCTGDDGTALVEMAFLLAPLCLLLFGIIVYGYYMSFRQNMTQAAAEGARAGAVAPILQAVTRANDATDKAVSSFGQRCNQGGMSCTAVLNTCPTASNLGAQCVTVTVRWNESSHPLLPPIPLVHDALPSEFVSSSSAQINR